MLRAQFENMTSFKPFRKKMTVAVSLGRPGEGWFFKGFRKV